MTSRPVMKRLLRSARAGTAHRRAARGEEGMTLIEVMIVVTVLAVLLLISVPIVATLLQTTDRVNTTYVNVDEQLWLSTNLQRLLRAAVAPEPSTAGATPVTPFVAFTQTSGSATPSLSPTAITFYANTGTRNGPVRVTASCTPTTSNKTLCAKPTSTLTITVTSPTAGSCPTTTSSSAVCTYSSSSKRVLVLITHLKDGADDIPLFTYSWGAEATAGQSTTVQTVCAWSGTPSGCSSTDGTVFAASGCLASTNATKPFAKCPVGEVAEVFYDIQINGKTTHLYGGTKAEDATGTFVFSPTSVLFDPAVG